MSNQKPGLRFRIPSWFAPASASSSQPPHQKSSDKSASTPPPTTHTSNTSSAAAKHDPPSDEVQNRNNSRTGTTPPSTQKTRIKPPAKPAQNSKLQSPTSKAKADSLPQARRTSQASPDKSDSPRKLNTQQPSTKATPASTTTPHIPLPSPSRSKPKKGSNHEFKSADEVVSKSSPPTNSPKSTTQLLKSEPNSGGELKPTNEMVSRVNTTISSQNSVIDGEPVATTSSGEANISSNEIPGQPKEQISKSQGDSESPIPNPGSVSSNMNYEREKILGSQLKPEVAKEVARNVEEGKDKEVEKEKNVINEVQSEQVQPRHSNGETKKNVSESPNQKPRIKNSNGEFLKGEEFGHNKVTRNDKPPQTRGDEGRAVSVITLAGENRGASMEIGSGSSSIRLVPINRGYMGVDHNKDETNNEVNPNKRESKKHKIVDDYSTGADTHINSNIQSINNSIMFNSSITERDPGVHVVRSNKTTADDKKKTVEAAHKAEFNATNAQKHTYEPPNITRRRCLRGLLLESSDDSDPEKPRRHGCRVPCNQVDTL